ncbi:MAG: hypothetical protein HF300_16935 [Ignavibacteria bacterium]|jgi:hypothetical protein|nr:hypothetical protein [Ignavibacteria bacterium]MCU7525991.1 hypothetical protein [Ignavibacteria bacterium]
MKKTALLLILLLIVLFEVACEKQITQNNELPKESVWEKVKEVGSLDIRALKVMDNVLYAAGMGSNSEAIFRTFDGLKWDRINLPDSANFSSGVWALTVKDGDIFVAPSYSYNKPIYKIEKNGTVVPVSPPVPIEISDLETIDDKIIIAPNGASQYELGVLDMSGRLEMFKDSLALNPTSGECYRRNGISPIAVSKILKDRFGNDILLGRYLGQFITRFNTSLGFQCFSFKGLSNEERMSGVMDLAWSSDTLLAATFSCVKMLVGNEWKVYNSYLPIKENQISTASSIAVNDNRVFVATSSDGVLESNSGVWKELNNGLPKYSNGFYPGVSNIVCFNGKLFIGYGTNKYPPVGLSGLYQYKITK